MSNEKRRYERFTNNDLSVSIARTGFRGMIRTNPSAECLNFSRTGLQFDCPQSLQPGETVLIDLAVDDIDVRDLKAEIVSRVKAPGGDWCHGVRFCLEEIKKNNVFRDLLLIENRLRQRLLYG